MTPDELKEAEALIRDLSDKELPQDQMNVGRLIRVARRLLNEVVALQAKPTRAKAK